MLSTDTAKAGAKIRGLTGRALFPAMLAIAFALNLAYVFLNTVWDPKGWSPIDEIAHYDYIDKLSEGYAPPRATDPIAPRTLEITRDTYGYTGDAASLGLAGHSYQAQHPPFYYALMALPNRLLKALELPAKVQMLGLRAIDQLFLLLACLLIVALFARAGLDPRYAWLLGSAIFVFGIERRYGVKPDNLSLLVNTCAAYALLAFCQTRATAWLTAAALAAVLALLTKYTNGYMLLLYVLTALFALRRDWIGRRQALGSAAPLLLVPAYVLWRAYQQRTAGLDWHMSLNYFVASVHPVATWHDFISLLGSYAFSLAPLANIPPGVVWVLLAGFPVSLALGLYQARARKDSRGYLLTLAAVLALAVIAAGLILNTWIHGVYWFEFRHYAGYSLFWLTAAGWPLLAWDKTRAWVLGILLAAFFVWAGAFALLLRQFPDPPYGPLRIQDEVGEALCLSLPARGRRLDLQPCRADSAGQQWAYNRFFKIVRNPAKQCLDVPREYHNQPGAPAQVWSCNGETNQQWELRDGRLRSAEGLCLARQERAVTVAECTDPAVLRWD